MITPKPPPAEQLSSIARGLQAQAAGGILAFLTQLYRAWGLVRLLYAVVFALMPACPSMPGIKTGLSPFLCLPDKLTEAACNEAIAGLFLWPFFGACGFIFIAEIVHFAATKYRDQERERTLANLNRMKTHADAMLRLFRSGLEQVITQLQAGPEERISLYYFSTKANEFELVARYSTNPVFTTLGRATFKKTGFIGATWDSQENQIAVHLPDPKNDPSGYLKAHLDAGLKQEEAANLRMKSRTYLGVRVLSEKTSRLSAVVIYESTKEISAKKAAQLTRELREFAASFFGNAFNGYGEAHATILDSVSRYSPAAVEKEVGNGTR